VFGGIFHTRTSEYLRHVYFVNLRLDISGEIYAYGSDEFVAVVDSTTRMVCHGQPYA
jgi:hypothetical protein